MKNLLLPLLASILMLQSCSMEKGYVCTCYYSDGTEMRTGVEFFQREMEYDKSKAEYAALETCIHNTGSSKPLTDTPTYATCIKKRIERR